MFFSCLFEFYSYWYFEVNNIDFLNVVTVFQIIGPNKFSKSFKSLKDILQKLDNCPRLLLVGAVKNAVPLVVNKFEHSWLSCFLDKPAITIKLTLIITLSSESHMTLVNKLHRSRNINECEYFHYSKSFIEVFSVRGKKILHRLPSAPHCRVN